MTEIPSGEFLMGSSVDESEFRENETPQHKVKVPEISIGKYPITQSLRWKIRLHLNQRTPRKRLESDVR